MNPPIASEHYPDHAATESSEPYSGVLEDTRYMGDEAASFVRRSVQAWDQLPAGLTLPTKL